MKSKLIIIVLILMIVLLLYMQPGCPETYESSPPPGYIFIANDELKFNAHMKKFVQEKKFIMGDGKNGWPNFKYIAIFILPSGAKEYFTGFSVPDGAEPNIMINDKPTYKWNDFYISEVSQFKIDF